MKLESGQTPDVFREIQKMKDQIDALQQGSVFGPSIVDSLPTNGLFEGRSVYLKAGLHRVLYVYSNNNWCRADSGATYLGDFTNNTTYLRFSNIPQTYKHLKVVWIGQSQRAGFANTGARCRINGLTANWYSYGYHYNGTPGGATTRFNTSFYVGQVPALSRTSDDQVTHSILDFPFYSRGDCVKGCQITSGGDDGTNSLWSRVEGVNVETGAAITSIDLYDDVSASLGPRSRAELWAS